MKILIACEYSATVREAFYKRGHYVWSCDYRGTEKPGQFGYHYQGDVRDMLSDSWDMLIAHPPCTYFSRAGIQFIHKQHDRKEKQSEAFEFVKLLWNAQIKKKCLENPSGWLCTNWKSPSQRIHPWYFGDSEMKETCLWLDNLPRLNGLYEVAMNPNKYRPKPLWSRMGSDGKMKNGYFCFTAKNAMERSRTFPAIANAMADQWG